jgi:hypothetical protein
MNSTLQETAICQKQICLTPGVHLDFCQVPLTALFFQLVDIRGKTSSAELQVITRPRRTITSWLISRSMASIRALTLTPDP